MKYFVTTFYKFIPIKQEQLKATQEHFKDFAKKRNIKGLMLIAMEGINSTICAPTEEGFRELKEEIKKWFSLTDKDFKDSYSHKQIFRIIKVAIRKEIVTLNLPNYKPEAHNPKHLTPTEWNEAIKDRDAVIVDTRNWYENNLGMMKNAIDLRIDEFTEFKNKLQELNLPKDKKILMYCTGGIRCEKAHKEAQDLGYSNVFQLKDGILRYLEEYPNREFEGECFVFDERVAVDQNLRPSATYAFCPHCGQPAKTIQHCKRCDTHYKICNSCANNSKTNELCSKDCAYQYRRFPNKKGEKQLQGYKAVKQNAYFLNQTRKNRDL